MGISEYGAFFSLTKVTYSLSICWVIFACHYGYGGIINKFLSASAFIPITRISYVSYLIHPVIMSAYYYSQEALFHGSGLPLVVFIFLFFYRCYFNFFDFVSDLFMSWAHSVHIFCCLLLCAIF
jgi:hypothetical protein